jgi:TonB family protein
VLITMARWLAVLAIVAGITMTILSQRVHLAALFESIRERSIGNSAPPRAGERPVAKTPPVFQVEAVDANNRRRLLTFDHDASAVEAWLSSGTAASSTKNSPFLVDPSPAGTTTAEKRLSLSNLNLGRPTVPRPATNASTKDPALAIDSWATSRQVIAADPSGGILAHIAKVPAAPPMPIEFQQARLISSVPPAYPTLARSIGLQGEITIDALIDSTGKVITMERLAGPVPLQQAAMDALQQWIYEPARLNGHPVPTHVSVTMKFRLH